jgi:hypothetical protein
MIRVILMAKTSCLAFGMPPGQYFSSRTTRAYFSSLATTSLASVKKHEQTVGTKSKKGQRVQQKQRIAEFWEARMDGVWRPTVNDVERISWGKPARKKGTGSRGVPHRLNLDERFLFDNARRKGFLEVDGSGWRSQRREAPILNTYRSLCDARGQASIVLHKGNTGVDELVVDISPLRNPDIFHKVAEACLEYHDGGEVIFQGCERTEAVPRNGDPVNVCEDLTTKISIVNDLEIDLATDRDDASPWEARPIYQLPPYCISWELPRNEAKVLGKKMAEFFDTREETATPSKKPIGLKPGRSRRHGGYGIG